MKALYGNRESASARTTYGRIESTGRERKVERGRVGDGGLKKGRPVAVGDALDFNRMLLNDVENV